jgi:hypothetical protein
MITGLNHSKPFGAQSPEQIAKDYGGNKQKIAQAMQMGIVDPTVGTLAGMFIDRMAAGAAQSQAAKGTVASQVFNMDTPAAQAPGGAGPGGLPPVPSAPQAPPANAAPPMPPQAPQGMADGGMVAFDAGGGVAGLPIPDDMFNSSVGDSDIQHYAGGAAVGQYGPSIEEQAFGAVPNINVTSRQRSAAHNAQVGGVGNSFHMTNNARDFTPPKGMSMDALFKQLGHLYGSEYDVINEGDHVHVEPGKRLAAGRPAPAAAPKGLAAATPAAPTATPATAAPAGLAAAMLPVEDMSAMREQMAMLSKSRADDLAAAKRERRQATWAALGQRGLAMLMPQGASMAEGGEVPSYAGMGSPVVQAPASLMPAMKDPMDAFKPANLQAMQSSISGLMPQTNKYADLMMADVERRRDPGTMQKDRKEVANQALMNFGLALMASKNPNFLGAIGEAGMPAAAGLKADIKDLKKDAHDALIEGAQAEGMKNTAARELAGLTLQNANIAAQLQSGNLDRAQRVELERLQRENAMKIAQINEDGANYRARLQETGANARAQLQASVTLGTEVKQTARVYRDQAEAARDKAMTLNREFMKETDPEVKAGLADQVLAELRNYSNYNNQFKAMGGNGVNWERSAFRTLNNWAKDPNNAYTIPYTITKTQAKTGGASSLQNQADAILAANQ